METWRELGGESGSSKIILGRFWASGRQWVIMCNELEVLAGAMIVLWWLQSQSQPEPSHQKPVHWLSSWAKPWVLYHWAEPSQANKNTGFLQLDSGSAWATNLATCLPLIIVLLLAPHTQWCHLLKYQSLQTDCCKVSTMNPYLFSGAKRVCKDETNP